MTSAEVRFDLPLFPLQSVLFPDGLLGLKVFEARYLDLVSTCMREQRPFGVVSLRRGTEARTPGEVEFERIGCMAELIEVDSAQPGILHVRCRGGARFETHESRQQADGLWVGSVSRIEADDSVLPTQELVGSAKGLANAIATLRQQGNTPADQLLEGARRAMRVAQLKEIDRLEQSLATLATVGSTSPYVGLFGTVWGIMSAFQGLGNVQQATLAMVAPGIAEALIATAMGLFAAIPAVVAYNRYADQVSRLELRCDTFMEEFSTILQRHSSAQAT